MSSLAAYINRQARNNLLFTSQEVDGINHVDVGRQLAEEIEGSLQGRHLGMKAEDALRQILRKGIGHHEEIGDYLAIKNIGILFEPALKFDVRTQFSAWSRDQVLIIKHEGEIRNNIFYLAPRAEKYSVNLNEIAYKSIQQ